MRHKEIISSILVLIPVINEKQWYVNYLCPFFLSHSEHSDAQLWYTGGPTSALICQNKKKSGFSDASVQVLLGEVNYVLVLYIYDNITLNYI